SPISVAPPRAARPATDETGVKWRCGVRHRGRFVLGASSPYLSWTRGSTSTPYCRQGPYAPEHALQSSMTWAARRCRRDTEAMMDVIYPRCAGLDVHKQTVVACARIAG